MAIKKRQKKASGGVPEWVVTFGDMMSLLLTFFILLQMFSELKRDQEYQRVVTAIKEAFGYSGGIGVLPTDDPPLKSVLEQMELLALKNYEDVNDSQTDVQGMHGPRATVTQVREGVMFTIGGPSTFDRFSAEVKPAMRQRLADVAVLLRGRPNKIIVRGHAEAKYLPPEATWRDLDELSYYRAHNVMGILIAEGLDERVFRLEAVGRREPVVPRAVEAQDAAENRRVEIILSEQLVDQFNTDADLTSPDLARGGSIDGR